MSVLEEIAVHLIRLAPVVFALLGASLFSWTSAADALIVDQRQLNQQQRIDQGVQSGALTRQEAARLGRGQARVDAMENRANADGKVTPRERQRLNQAQDVQNRNIARAKHNRRVR